MKSTKLSKSKRKTVLEKIDWKMWEQKHKDKKIPPYILDNNLRYLLAVFHKGLNQDYKRYNELEGSGRELNAEESAEMLKTKKRIKYMEKYWEKYTAHPALKGKT